MTKLDHSFATSAHFELFQSDAFREARTRVQQSSTPPASSPSSVAIAMPPTSERQLRDTSMTPSPPASESSSSFNHTPTSNTSTSFSEASDSSAGSSSSSEMDYLHSTRKERPPTHATKRVLSEGDVIAPRPAKRSCNAIASALRKRSAALASSVSDSTTNPFDRDPRFSLVNAWRSARQRRHRGLHHHKTRATSANAIIPTKQPEPRSDVLPELRLLSATRTAPIGWSQLSKPAAFAPKMVEVYDERDAVRAPERHRFWPIVDKQLDYTGARMLSLSTASPYQPVNLSHHRAKPDELESPKSTLPPIRAYYGASSSDSSTSPLTPDAPLRSTTIGRAEASTYAKHTTRTEGGRNATIPLSPKATL